MKDFIHYVMCDSNIEMILVLIYFSLSFNCRRLSESKTNNRETREYNKGARRLFYYYSTQH